MIIRSCKI